VLSFAVPLAFTALPASYQGFVAFMIFTMLSITVTSIRTPTTVARGAGVDAKQADRCRDSKLEKVAGTDEG
jgi:hypothetical protein